MQPYAMWTSDCQGKQDYDGEIISVSTRYWPGPGGGPMIVERGPLGTSIRTGSYGPRPSAHASIHLNYGPRSDGDGGGDYLVWQDQKFEADTEAEVKAAVEEWVSRQMANIIERLGGRTAFRED